MGRQQTIPYGIRLIEIIFCAIISNLAFTGISAQNIPSRPQPARFVNDYVNQLSVQDRQLLENKLKSYSDKTSNQIVIVIVPALEGHVLEDYSHKLAESWGIGQRGKDNGLLILTSISERKVRIETGYGMEDAIPDLIAKRIIDNLIVPDFRKGNFAGAYNQAVDFLIKVIENKNSGNQAAYEKIHNELDLDSEDRQAVFGGRIILYIFWSIFFLGMFAIYYSSRTVKLKLIGFSNMIFMFMVLIYGEWLYKDSIHSAGFWFFQFLVPFIVLIAYKIVFRKIRYRESRYSLLLKYTQSDDSWKKLNHLYRNPEVSKKFLEYKDIIKKENLDPGKIKKINKLISGIQDILQAPHKYFKKKSNAELVDICDKIQSMNILKNKMYQKKDRDDWTVQINQQLDYFKPMENEEPGNEDKDRQQSFIKKIQALKDEPKKYLKIDYQWIDSEVDQFFKNKDIWAAYRSAYTASSISRANKKFSQLKMDLDKTMEVRNDLYYKQLLKIYEQIASLKKNPGLHLKKKAVYISSASTSWSSSGSSYSSTFGSSSSFSSSSFGGGSFGGGGASGSW